MRGYTTAGLDERFWVAVELGLESGPDERVASGRTIHQVSPDETISA